MKEMLHDEKQFEDIAGRLRDELSLVSDEEYYRRVLNESRDIYDYLQKEYQKGLDEIELTEIDLSLLDFIKNRLPHSFWVLNELNEEFYEYSSMAYLKKFNYRYVDDFIQALCKGGWDGEIKEDLYRYEFNEEWPDNPNEEKLEDVLMLVDSLLKGKHCWEKEALLRELINNHPRQNKTMIIKSILSNNYDEDMSTWHSVCFDILKDSWWDDALIPIVEGYKGDGLENLRAGVIALHFPYDYVLEPSHRQYLEYLDYESVCCRLAREEGFIIDKSKMERLRYFRILAINHIHIEDSEADRLLFEHIGLWLHTGWRHLSKKVTIDWNRFIRLDFERYKYEDVLPLWFSYKPTLYDLPLVKIYALYLCSMGNTNTLAKLITWEHFLRSNIKSLIEENELEMVKVNQIPDVFVDNIDRMWRRFFELAIETCPIEKDQIKDEFISHYEDEFKSYDGQYE